MPMTRKRTRRLRSKSRCPSGRFSSSTSMESPERFVFDHEVGDGDGLGDGVFRDLAIPLADDLVPGHPIFELFEDDPDHDAGALERGLAAADFRVGHDVAPQLDSMNTPVRLCFHASAPTMRSAEFDCKPTNGNREIREQESNARL